MQLYEAAQEGRPPFVDVYVWEQSQRVWRVFDGKTGTLR